jgi:rhodanese-related sulfurtransferase
MNSRIKVMMFSAALCLAAAGASCTTPPDTATDPGVAQGLSDRKPYKDVTPAETSVAAAVEGVQFIDVRAQSEFEARHAPNSVNIPLAELAGRMSELDSGKPTFVICEIGLRSEEASQMFVDAGFRDVRHVKGGIGAWVKAGLPVVME